METRDTLPPPSPEALAHSARVVEHVRRELAADGGWMTFARYMELVLYAPGLGYYSAGARKLGADGDFTTAPELTPLYGHCIAQQARQILALGLDEILEVGAGSGALAAELLEELDRLGAAPRRFLILELSADLRARSRDLLAERVPHLMERIAWLNVLPPAFEGMIIGNEVLDAMPVHIVRATGRDIEEGGVVASRGDRPFEWSFRPAAGELRAAADQLGLAPGYVTEIALAARAFVRSVGAILERGVMLFVDYGFPAREYYHPQRAQGTLMCHYRHRAHTDPFFLPGLQDVTAHVDFSAIAAAASRAELDVLGYTSQEQFLVNCGITDLMLRTSPEDPSRYLPTAAAASKLLSPAEMGELFKAIAFGRGVPDELAGFASGDRRHTL
ncbi:MAG: SAM-dependent methyltransferase [Burkholderiales bacterium]